MRRWHAAMFAVALASCTAPGDGPAPSPSASATYTSAMVLPFRPRWITARPDGCISGEHPRIADAEHVDAVLGDFDGDGGSDDEFITYWSGRKSPLVQVVFEHGRRATRPHRAPEFISGFLATQDFGGGDADEILIDIGGQTGARAAVLFIDGCRIGLAARPDGSAFAPSHRDTTLSCRGACLAGIVCTQVAPYGIGEFSAGTQAVAPGTDERVFRWRYEQFVLDDDQQIRRVDYVSGVMEFPSFMQGMLNGVHCDAPLHTRSE